MNVVNPIMFALISANLINIVGDWALIYGHLGLPAMGIVGSGWSTCFARVYLVAVLVIALVLTESKRKLESWQGAVSLDFHRMMALLRLGIPAATQILFEIGAFTVATVMCARLGPMPLSGHEIALSCASLTFMVPLGISSAAAVRVGQELGRGDRLNSPPSGMVSDRFGRRVHERIRPNLCKFFPNSRADLFSPIRR